MTTKPYVALHCDGYPSGVLCDREVSWRQPAWETRRTARTYEGWRYSMGRDYCPEHWAIRQTALVGDGMPV